MSVIPVKIAGAVLVLLAVVLALLATGNGSVPNSLLALMTVVAAIVAAVRPGKIASLGVAVAIICLVAMIAIRPPTGTVGLLLLVPFGVVTVLGSLLITSQSSIVESLNPAEWSILLATGVVAALVVVIAMVTPIAEIAGQLISGAFIIIAIAVLYQLVRRSRDTIRQ
jgi:hypothetical protein